MFNTDSTVPAWEKSPENHTTNAENEKMSERAQAWNEAFPNEETENPWLTADMETNEAPDESLDESEEQPGINPNPSQEEDVANQLNDSDNIVTNQMQQVWRGGEGGQSLDSAYDELRGSFTPENIKTSADAVEPEIADTIRENSAKSLNSEAELAITNNLDQETTSISNQEQTQADLYNLTTSAGATALGAQASVEMAINSLQSDNESDTAAAQRDLEEARRTLEDIQSNASTITSQLEGDPLTLHTTETTINEAQDMVAQAQESLQAAQDAATERQEFIEDNQDTINELQEQGVQMAEINQTIDENGNLEELKAEVQPEEEDDEYAEPRQSIFG